MINKDDRKLSRNISWGMVAIIGGAVSFCMCGVFGTLVKSMPLITIGAIGLVAAVIGLFTIGGSVFSGLRSEKRAHASDVITRIPDTRIVARFIVNGVGEMVFSEEFILDDDPKVKYYVRIQPPAGRQIELRSSPEVWRGCGEGLRGEALVQGDWLNGFAPIRGTGQGDPYRS